MPRRSSESLFARAVLSIVVMLLSVTFGCREAEQIEQRRVAKPVQPVLEASGDPTDRMLAAMIMHGDKAWFFKVAGPLEQVARNGDAIRSFLASVRFDAAVTAEPTWTLPDGWKQNAGTGMRLATLTLGEEPRQLELTVTPLGVSDPDQDRYLLGNVNRWRRQMGQPPLGPDSLATEVTEFAAGDKTVYLVEILGRQRAGGMGPALGQDPHAGLPGFGGGKRPSRDGGSAAEGFDPTLLTCQPPEAWQAGPVRGMRKASYSVEDDDGKQIEITIIAAGGDMLANINRWRGQIQLDPMTQQQLDEALQPIESAGASGKYIELFPAADAAGREAIIGAIIPQNGVQWFVKLKGDAGLAKSETQRFKQFVESLAFKDR